MTTPIYLNLGCGGNILPAPWHNFDLDLDIRKPLPFNDATVDLIFAEHVVEHVTPAEAWRFFRECRRVLRPQGVLRVAVPSIERVFERSDREYLAWMHGAGFGAPTKEAAVENQIVNHGHQAIWSAPLLLCCFDALGFARAAQVGVAWSEHAPLRDIHGHGRVIGERNNEIETIVVEAVR